MTVSKNNTKIVFHKGAHEGKFQFKNRVFIGAKLSTADKKYLSAEKVITIEKTTPVSEK